MKTSKMTRQNEHMIDIPREKCILSAKGFMYIIEFRMHEKKNR